MKLDAGQQHFLRLARMGMASGADGWAKVSKVVWPLMATMPEDLLEREPFEDGSGRCRLTDRGEAVLDYSSIMS